jgi:predicted porin
MKKSLVALAALAVAGVASAQSSVTLFGVVDAAISNYQNTSQTALGTNIKTSQTALTNSGYNSSRLGFRGTEDLGGGLAASFWLEASLSNDDGFAGQGGSNGAGPNTNTGNQFFNRRSTVSLSGAFGEVRLGRDYVPTFWNDTVFDPFGTNGAGTNLISTASGYGPGAPSGFTANGQYVRASNSVGYFLPPNLGGFYGQVMYAMNESLSYNPGALTPPGAQAIVNNPALLNIGNNARAGRYIGGRVGYANGPLDVALAYGESTIASNYFAGTTQNLDIWNLGASWDFGVVKLFGEYSNNKLKNDSNSSIVNIVTNPFAFREPGANGGLIGVTVPVGPGLIRASYSTVKYNNTSNINQLTGLFADPKADKWALGYVHNLSKRTALYATVGYVNNKDGAALSVGGAAAPGGSPFYTLPVTINGIPFTPIAQHSVGYDFGIRHAF